MGLTIRDLMKYVSMFDVDLDAKIVIDSVDADDLRLAQEFSNEGERDIVKIKDYKE